MKKNSSKILILMSPYPQFFFFAYHPSILELIGVITTMIFLIVVIIPFCSHVLFPVAKKYLTNLCHVKKMDVLGNNIKRIISENMENIGKKFDTTSEREFINFDKIKNELDKIINQ